MLVVLVLLMGSVVVVLDMAHLGRRHRNLVLSTREQLTARVAELATCCSRLVLVLVLMLLLMMLLVLLLLVLLLLVVVVVMMMMIKRMLIERMLIDC